MMVVCNAAHGYSVWLLKRKLSLGDTRCDAVVVPSAATTVAASLCVSNFWLSALLVHCGNTGDTVTYKSFCDGVVSLSSCCVADIICASS